MSNSVEFITPPHSPFHLRHTGYKVWKFDQKLIPFAKLRKMKPKASLWFILKIQFVSYDFLFVFSATKIKKYCLYKRYFNADLKISLYVWVLMKIIPRHFRILNPKNFSFVSASSLTNISYIWGGYISGSKRCYNAKFSVGYFYVKMNLSLDFKICIGIPLTFSYYTHVHYSYQLP